MPARERKGREGRFNEPGLQGRLTGIPMPTNVPRNEDGAEDPDAFFASPRSYRGPASSAKKAKPVARSANNSLNSSQNRRQPRPDMHHELGQKGRKTGIKINRAPLNDDGIEDVDRFYGSSPHSSPRQNNISRSSAGSQSVEPGRRQHNSRRLTDIRSQDYDEGINDEDEMHLESDSGMTPRTYMKASSHVAHRPLTSAHRGTPNSSSSRPSSANRSNRPNLSSPIWQISSPHSVKRPRDEIEFPRVQQRQAPARAASLGFEDGGLDDIPEDEEVDFSPRQQNRMPANGHTYDSPRRLEKGKGRAVEPEPALYGDNDFGGDGMGEHMEDEGYSGGEGGYDKEPQDDESVEDEPPPRSPLKKKAKPLVAQVRLERVRRPDTQDDDDGVRRSQRPHIQPVEYWRNERVLYERRRSGLGIKAVVRIPKPSPLITSNTHHYRRKTPVARARSRQDSQEVKDEVEDYTGWDDGTDQEGLTWDFVTSSEVRRRIAFTAAMVHPKAINKQDYRFQKVFSDGDFMAGGVLEIPVGAKKPLKPARDNTYMLFCLQGAVRVLVYRTTFTIANGGFFLVPRGNSYEIENISNVDVRLIFMQSREVRVIEAPEEEGQE